MNVETITKLLDAGYSKEEIERLEAGDAPAGAGDAAGNVLPAEEKGEESANEVSTNDAIKALTDTVAGLTATVKAMQDANVKGAVTDSPKAGDKISDVMQSFIDKL